LLARDEYQLASHRDDDLGVHCPSTDHRSWRADPVAAPVRPIFRDSSNIDVLFGTVTGGLLVGVRNRVATLVNWFWAYSNLRSAIRPITGPAARG
jgi:hypothetical protein